MPMSRSSFFKRLHALPESLEFRLCDLSMHQMRMCCEQFASRAETSNTIACSIRAR
jgi:hypothetical protein